MSLVFDDFPEIQRRVEKLQREVDRAMGAYNLLLSRLKKEFGVENFKEAEALLAKLLDKEVGLLAKYNRAREEFDKKWEERLKMAARTEEE